MDGFVSRVVTIAPESELLYDEGEWIDALVLLHVGQVELEGRCGARCTLRHGAIFWLDGVPLRALHNIGRGPAALIVLTRRR
jgi:hypothetical protein